MRAALVPNDRWSSDGAVLYRQSRKMHEFPANIHRIDAVGHKCVVATGTADDQTLWVEKRLLATAVKRWILTPLRVVYELADGNIMAWDFRIAPVWVARGRLCSASDTRVIYDDGTARRWQNGTTPFADRYLTRTDEILTWEELYDRMDQFI